MYVHITHFQKGTDNKVYLGNIYVRILVISPPPPPSHPTTVSVWREFNIKSVYTGEISWYISWPVFIDMAEFGNLASGHGWKVILFRWGATIKNSSSHTPYVRLYTSVSSYVSSVVCFAFFSTFLSFLVLPKSLVIKYVCIYKKDL